MRPVIKRHFATIVDFQDNACLDRGIEVVVVRQFDGLLPRPSTFAPRQRVVRHARQRFLPSSGDFRLIAGSFTRAAAVRRPVATCR